MQIFVIYHSADFDGLFCREIAARALPEATLIGWDYGNSEPEIPVDALLYILDLSVPGLMSHPNLIWIDHHKSAIEKYPATIVGYRIDGVAACRLTWQWLHGNLFAHKDAYVNHKVTEPESVRLAGEYDIWDKRDPNAELFQHGLKSIPLTDGIWDELLEPQQLPRLVEQLLANASIIQYAKTKENESIIKTIGFDITYAGLTFLACNHAHYNSFLFTAGLCPHHDACLGFKWTGKDWSISLYHAPGKEHIDLSLIAVKHGGGGHKGACGFRVSDISFITNSK